VKRENNQYIQEAQLEEQPPANAALEKRCSDYDYLVGMAIWKLSMEDKDKLLAESESKKKELEVLKGKEWSDLYEEDLVAFMDALDAQVGLIAINIRK
jgi:DNA topoisomerase-2